MTEELKFTFWKIRVGLSLDIGPSEFKMGVYERKWRHMKFQILNTSKLLLSRYQENFPQHFLGNESKRIIGGFCVCERVNKFMIKEIHGV